MILDSLFGNDDQNDQNNPQSDRDTPQDEQQQKEKEVNDASAARYTGAHGYTQRSDQKDQLENLHIGGGEGETMGGTEHNGANEQQQGPGFEVEGSYELDHDVRTKEQKFGEDAPSGPASTPQDM
jgi:hypothetical protein